MEWSDRRKILYSLIFAGVIILLAAYPVYKLVSKAPTCFDNMKNGTETGVDCGGGCALMCAADMKQPGLVWARAFPLIDGKYDVAAYVENANNNAGLKNAHYTIQVLDSQETVLVEKKGAIELPPASRILIFETGVPISGQPATVRLTFDPVDLSQWFRATTAASPVVTKNQEVTNADTMPRFDAVLVNTDPVNDVSNLTLGAIIYDTSRNPVAVSKTYVDNISRGGEQNIFFTWPSRITKYPRGAMCTASGDLYTTPATSTPVTFGSKKTSTIVATSTAPVACPAEHFITELVVTPRAIFSE